MPVNRNALVRYKTIDNCLRNRYRKWTLEKLIDACSDALYEYEGIDKGVSRRTIQMDIQMMRSEKLGYNAPIVISEKKYYTYEDPEYSITNIPLTGHDLEKLTEVTQILRQFKGFTHFGELSGMVQKLEDKIHVSKTKGRPVIDLEKNENLKGLELIDPIFQAITKQKCLEFTYKSFKARNPETFIFHPALLKEYRNRWFILGKKNADLPFMLLALDRIEKLAECSTPSIVFNENVLNGYFKNVVGVSVSEGLLPQKVLLFVDHSNAPYVLTKPIHHSQQLLERNDQGVLISLYVQLNFELDREILGFGDRVKVVSPPRLRTRIREILKNAGDIYDTELNQNTLKSLSGQLDSKGSVILNRVYTEREVNRMGRILQRYSNGQTEKASDTQSVRNVLREIPELRDYLINPNIKAILKNINPDLFLTKSIFFNKSQDANWYVTWHQDASITVKHKKSVEGYSGWKQKGDLFGVRPPEQVLKSTYTMRVHLDDTTSENGALKVLLGSQNKIFDPVDLSTVTENSIAHMCEVNGGGIHLMKPLLLHASSKSKSKGRRRVIHLEFNSRELDRGLEWGERMEIS